MKKIKPSDTLTKEYETHKEQD